ncbi:MAG: PKD domain-containing protein [Bacteroidetes bacterium]|nr:PKD domain-containing protein [Bacteroidota bacterium]
MKTLITIFIILVSSVCSLQAQNGWKDMGTYKESTDTTGQIQQLKITPDGKYVYCLTTLTEQKKSNLYLQKWSIDSGTIVFSRFIDPILYAKIYGINLNCDAATYSVCATLPSNPSEYRLLVKDNETDNLLVSVVDKTDEAINVNQIDYDSVFKCFYFSCNSMYYKREGYVSWVFYSTGYLKSKTISSDSLIDKIIASPNSKYFSHKLGTNIISTISNYYYEQSTSITPYQGKLTIYNTNYINYIGFPKDSSSLLANYVLDGKPKELLTLSPSGKQVAATNANTISTWYVDSARVNPLNVFPQYANALDFTSDDKYLLACNSYDSCIFSVNVGLRKICGSVKLPVISLVNTINSLPNSNTVLAHCADGRFRLITALKDTLQPFYSFTSNKVKVYEKENVSFCPIIPSFENNKMEWNFGDSKSSASVNPNHSYDIPGFYDVVMKVTDETGDHSIIQKKYIEVISRELVLDFEADKTYGVAPHIVHFINKSSGPILSYKWNFGDKTSSDEKEPTHIFTNQQFYTITLTVNDGIKDTSITKLHYINADEYPTFGLHTTLTEKYKGEHFSDPIPGKQTHTTINLFENLIQDKFGTAIVKVKKYEILDVKADNFPYDYTTYGHIENEILTVTNAGKFEFRIGSAYNQNYNISSKYVPFLYSNGTIGLLNNNLVSLFYLDYNYGSTAKTCILHGNNNQQSINFPFATAFYTVKPLKNNIDCYVFREKESISSNTTLCFYSDTNKLLSKDPIEGYAIPAVETSSNQLVCVVSPTKLDSLGARIYLRYYTSNGSFINSTIIPRLKFEFINDIIRLPNNKFLLSGYTENFDGGRHLNGLILIVDEAGNVELTKELPQWQTFIRIMKMDEETFAITGYPRANYPGFIAVKSDGKVVGDFRSDITYGSQTSNYVTTNPNAVNVAFGKTMNTVFFTRNSGYDAELYVSDNPFLKDINVSVKEESKEQIPSTNSINFAPNPTDGLTTIQYNSTNEQTITITVVSVVGQVLMKQVVQVSAGRNDIPLDVSRFGSGVVFVNISDTSAVYHGQLHIIR